MTWTRLSDDFTDRPDFLRLSRSARLFHIEVMVYSNRHGLDGRIPTASLQRLTDADDIADLINELVIAGYWTGDGDEWCIDWSDQEPAEDVAARKTYRAATQKRYRQRKDRHARGDHSMCDPRYCTRSVTGNEGSNKTSHETPSRPVPSRPQGRDRDRDAEAGSAGAPPARLQHEYDPLDECCPLPAENPIHTDHWTPSSVLEGQTHDHRHR